MKSEKKLALQYFTIRQLDWEALSLLQYFTLFEKYEHTKNQLVAYAEAFLAREQRKSS